MATDLNSGMSKTTSVFGLKIWQLVAVFVSAFIVIILGVSLCLSQKKKSRIPKNSLPTHIPQIPIEIKEIRVDESSNNFEDVSALAVNDKNGERNLEKVLLNGDIVSNDYESFGKAEKDSMVSRLIEEEERNSSVSIIHTPSSPLSDLPEFSHLGWGHWFTLRDLEVATRRFSKENIIGEGGYGVVYQGNLTNGISVAVKKLLNNL